MVTEPAKLRFPATLTTSKTAGEACALVLPVSSQLIEEPLAYARSPAKVWTPGELPGEWLPAMVTLPEMTPDPPKLPPAITRREPPQAPFTRRVPASTLLSAEPNSVFTPVKSRRPVPVFTKRPDPAMTLP